MYEMSQYIFWKLLGQALSCYVSYRRQKVIHNIQLGKSILVVYYFYNEVIYSMEFTFIQKSIHGDKIYYPKKFFIHHNSIIDGFLKPLMLSKEKQEAFKNAFTHAFSYNVTNAGFEWEIWPVFVHYRKKNFKEPEFIIRYKDQRLNLLDFLWPGFRDDAIIKEAFLQKFGPEKLITNISFELKEEYLYKILMKFQNSLIFTVPFGPSQDDEEFYIEEELIDLIDMRPVTFHHVKHDESLNFTLCANDFVSLLNSSVITVRERK